MTLVTIFALIGVSFNRNICLGRHKADCNEQVSGHLLLGCVADLFFPFWHGSLLWQHRAWRLQVLLLFLPRHNCHPFTDKWHLVVFEPLSRTSGDLAWLRIGQRKSRCDVYLKCNEWQSCSTYKVDQTHSTHPNHQTLQVHHQIEVGEWTSKTKQTPKQRRATWRFSRSSLVGKRVTV